ncbi:phosphatase PAP2 family protein [Acinetobacter qingfengensis]|uniref:undecaprenyl-diphosphate phosphatase n=1 Tax=Acinetobacter qingfengensis TaxID=1262585 RepID=A0A1E7R1B9_9GAMM|nr:phosphatase PAP2 family protein [Acinetobacter qingfengensis]KAA8733254.1 phosphatase PAP2 family protein [Acinetobacter qingfengensis]OEY93113.1 phosphatidylglycerophosphatase [Acinetobacter qingfengensis]
MSKIRHAQKAVLDWDLRSCIYLNHWSENIRVANFFKLISRLGDGIFWYVMLAVVWLIHGLTYFLQAIYLLLASSFGTIIYKLLKRHTVRPRPYQVHQVIRLGERPLDHFSFPSGHTLHAVMVTTVLGSIVPALLMIMLPFSLLVAISRMVLGLHYPTDVIVGATLGLLVALITLWLAPVFEIIL